MSQTALSSSLPPAKIHSSRDTQEPAFSINHVHEIRFTPCLSALVFFPPARAPSSKPQSCRENPSNLLVHTCETLHSLCNVSQVCTNKFEDRNLRTGILCSIGFLCAKFAMDCTFAPQMRSPSYAGVDVIIQRLSFRLSSPISVNRQNQQCLGAAAIVMT